LKIINIIIIKELPDNPAKLKYSRISIVLENVKRI